MYTHQDVFVMRDIPYQHPSFIMKSCYLEIPLIFVQKTISR